MDRLWSFLTLTGHWLFGLLLLAILIEDFKYRAVRWWFFPLSSIMALGIEYKDFRVTDVFINNCFILIQVAMLSLYFSIKEKKPVNITHQYLGWGDILMWLVFCVLFSPLNFVLFFMASLVFVSLLVLIWKIIKMKPVMTTLPLAGLQALALLVLWTVALLSDKISFRNDQWIISWLTT